MAPQVLDAPEDSEREDCMSREMDAVSLLKRDHEMVKDLMQRITESETDRTAAMSMFEQLVDDLSIHERIEEEIFYPALKTKREMKDEVLESYEEHHLVDEIIEELDDVTPEDERWPAKFKVLRENIEHHIKDEEEKLLKEAEQHALMDQETDEEVETTATSEREADRRKTSGRSSSSKKK
jgi:hypothetical protein